MHRIAVGAFLGAIVLGAAPYAFAQSDPAARPPDLSGVYQSISDATALSGGQRNAGSPNDIVLLPPAAEQAKTIGLQDDPVKRCQPIGPFRMMAREGTKIEIMPVPNMVVILHEDVAHGLMRPVYLNRSHPKEFKELLWLGESIGRWEADTFVVDTVGFNDSTWLNDKGAQHSEALHLVERIRPILGGQYLEYRVTADDPKVLAGPYTYTRYYEKVNSEIMEDICYVEGFDPTSPELSRPGR